MEQICNKCNVIKPLIDFTKSTLSKNGKTIDLLGYSALELKNHITSLFTEGMSWNNHGEWHIDHIIPVSKFDKDTHPSVVNALSNLQPLWAIENRKKYNKIN